MTLVCFPVLVQSFHHLCQGHSFQPQRVLNWHLLIGELQSISPHYPLMPLPLQKSPSIGELSDKTPLEDFVTHRTRQTIEALEEELVAAIYQQREWEQEILSFNPQSDAPAGIVQSFTQSKLKVQEIELKLRQVRHSF